MRYAIISDIHANWEALRVVFEDIKAQSCTHLACLGDLAGYYFNPKECVDLVRHRDIPCVKGNFDEYCSSEEPLEGFNPRAAEGVNWTRQQLTEDDRKWMRELPLVRFLDGFSMVHATLDQPSRWQYIFDKHAAAAHFQYQTTRVCFNGHTHVPVAFIRHGQVRGGTYSRLEIEPGRKYLVNPGSVGQPRDGTKKASYAIYDLDAETIELRRLDFPPGGSRGGGKPGSSVPAGRPPGSRPPPRNAADPVEG